VPIARGRAQPTRVKTPTLRAALPLLLALNAPLFGQVVTTPVVSPAASVSQTIGITEVKVTYHRPSVLKREIWGKLVPFGFNDLGFGSSKAAPWRAGANENTLISLQHDALVAGSPVAAGTYGLFMALAEDGTVTVILSRDTGFWGSFFYDPAHDAMRAATKLEDSPFHELLTYDFSDVTEDSAVLALSWGDKRIPIPIKVDTVAVTEATLRQELASAKGFQYQAWLAASAYLLQHDRDLPLALEWAEHSVSDQNSGERNFNTLSNKASILFKMGREADSTATMDEAMKYATVLDMHQYARSLLKLGRKERAMEVFKRNAEEHPGVWPVDYGLARGYSAMGDYKAALEALTKAQAEIPKGDALNAAAMKINLDKLQRGVDIN
jgi:tetratricopeptide (TPR) repeat protein